MIIDTDHQSLLRENEKCAHRSRSADHISSQYLDENIKQNWKRNGNRRVYISHDLTTEIK